MTCILPKAPLPYNQVRPNLQWVKCGDYEQIGDIYYIDNGQDYLDEYGMIDLDLIEDNEELFL